jgi:hypothetical protein
MSHARLDKITKRVYNNINKSVDVLDKCIKFITN